MKNNLHNGSANDCSAHVAENAWAAVSNFQIKTCSHYFFAWQWFQQVELDPDRAPLARAAAIPRRRCEFRLVTSGFNHMQVSLPSRESSWWLMSGEECWECFQLGGSLFKVLYCHEMTLLHCQYWQQFLIVKPCSRNINDILYFQCVHHWGLLRIAIRTQGESQVAIHLSKLAVHLSNKYDFFFSSFFRVSA